LKFSYPPQHRQGSDEIVVGMGVDVDAGVSEGEVDRVLEIVNPNEEG
jgi:hypothetical protein